MHHASTYQELLYNPRQNPFGPFVPQAEKRAKSTLPLKKPPRFHLAFFENPVAFFEDGPNQLLL